jgi:DNA-binding CsgD family transcriptional regulator
MSKTIVSLVNLDPALTRGEAARKLVAADLQVYRLVAAGMERNEIASKLGVSRSVVNRHMAKGLVLTGASNAVQLIAILTESGVLSGNAMADRSRVRSRVARIFRDGMVKSPQDDTERHVNDVVTQLAAAVVQVLS